MKLAFVVQRYGEQISGGAELHCRLVAERFAARGDEVHVYTTCALDYMSWDNHFAPGIQKLNEVWVHRFPVDYSRDVKHFNELSEKVFGKQAGKRKEEEWMRAQGPYASELFRALDEQHHDFSWIIFFGYLYATTYFGLQKCAQKAILAPLAHDEPPIYLDIFQSVFSLPRAIIYNSEEERLFIQTRFGIERKPSILAGMWIPEPLPVEPNETFYKKAKTRKFIVYIGRIDASKGCEELVRYFMEYKEQYPSDMKLLMMGKGDMKLPNHEDVIIWGFASEEEKWQALRGAVASVIPSLYESLSMALLESFVVARPVIVNENCEVTKAHCVKSNGGLWYRSSEEFSVVLEYLRKTPLQADTMGKNGKRYAEQNYSSSKIVQKYEDLFEELAQGNA